MRTRIQKIKKFLKDDLDKFVSTLKANRDPEQRRRNKAKGRWFVTIGFFAFVLMSVVYIWMTIKLLHLYHIAWPSAKFCYVIGMFAVGVLLGLGIVWQAIAGWLAWHEIRREEQTSQAIPSVGVWPPPPRCE